MTTVWVVPVECGGSELFSIENFEAKAIARIFIVRCPDADYTHVVNIYKVDGENERIVERMVEVPERYRDDSDFFATYWAKNYKKFE